MVKRLSLKVIFPLIFILSFSDASSLNSINIKQDNNKEYILLYDLINQFNLVSEFDIISGKGKLYFKGHSAVYNVGLSLILIDNRLYKSSYPVKRLHGEILLPYDIGEMIIASFYPSIVITKTPPHEGEYGGVLTYELKNEKSNDVLLTKKKTIYKKAGIDKINFIVIDPGHGGNDPGAVGKGGIKEKIITLKVAKFLEKRLKESLKDIEIKLTRHDDRFIELENRTKIANKMLKKNKNGLFLSIHVNASISGKISGYETYFLSQNPTNEDARNTAALENNVIILEQSKKVYEDIDYIEAMMLTTQILKESSLLAGSIQKGIVKNSTIFKSRGVRKADFFVLRGVLMPAVLIEIGFITNEKEAKYLKTNSYQKKIAYGIADGVVLFIQRYNSLVKGK